MLIRFFRSSFLAQYFLLVVIAVVLWIPAFISAPPLPASNPVTPVYNLILILLPQLPWVAPLIALLITLITALILNNVFIYHDLIPKNSLLPAFLFMLFMSSSPMTISLYPAMLALLPMAFFVHQAYRLYEQYENPNNVLSLGILASVSSMIYFPVIIFVLYIWLVFMLYRVIDWRQWTIGILGFVLPYVYLLAYYFWTDRLADTAMEYTNMLQDIFTISATGDLFQISIWVIFGLLMLMPAMVRTMSTLGSQNITFRRKMAATIWMVIFWAATFVFPGDIAYNTLIYMPAAGIVAFHFHSMKKSAWNELVLLSYMILIGVHNYLNL